MVLFIHFFFKLLLLYFVYTRNMEVKMKNNEEFLLKSIGKKIKLARLSLNYTQEQLAEKLGLSTRYVSQLERGIAFGSATTIIKLCKTLNISSEFLFNDLINNTSSMPNDFVDIKFLENYLKLDEYNKNIVKTLTNNLLKLQENKKAI